VIKAHVVEGVIKRFDTDERPDKGVSDGNDPQLRACLRCRAYLGRLYHPGRLLYPLKQTKERGDISGFVRISWDEALTLVASELKRVRARYGNESIFPQYGSGARGVIHGRRPLLSLLNYFGGYLGYWGNYSTHQHGHMAPFIVGRPLLFATPDSLISSKLIILWGSNFAETIMGTNTPWYVMQAKEAGARIVYVGPYQNDTCATYADQWIPIRPGTDTAMMLAMIHVMIEEDLLDLTYIKEFVHGFYDDPQNHVPHGGSLSAYIMGSDARLVSAGLNADTCRYPDRGDISRYPYKAMTRIPKTPEWASEITGVPQATIRNLAREYANPKNPAFLHCCFGMQRQKEGCQAMFMMYALAAVTGQWGKPGTGAGIRFGTSRGRIPLGGFPGPQNPVTKKITPMLWTDAARNPGQSEWGDGEVNALRHGIKFIMNFSSNCLINQHMDVNKTKKLLRDRSKIEFICAIDNFMVPSVLYADIVLPGATNWEQNDLFTTWGTGDSVLFANKAVDPPGEAKTTYEMLSLLADKLGFREAFTQGKSEEDWLRTMWKNTGEPISYEELKKRGVYIFNLDKPPLVGGQKIREHGSIDPQREDLRFNTKESGDIKRTGKIEVYSRALVHEYENRGAGQINRDDGGDPIVYPIPMYFPEAENAQNSATGEFPFVVLTPHARYSTLSTHVNNPYLRELNKFDVRGNPAYDGRCFGVDPLQPRFDGDGLTEVWINAEDAKSRGIDHRDRVKVYNRLGTVITSAKVTQRVMPGVLVIYEGSWYDPDETGVDHGGCTNVLTTEQPSRVDHGNAQMIACANIQKV
jgi:anaerobic dimethyl sulfoxide reductase subunit A